MASLKVVENGRNREKNFQVKLNSFREKKYRSHRGREGINSLEARLPIWWPFSIPLFQIAKSYYGMLRGPN